MKNLLKDKNVLITGAGRGIGKRLAIGLAQMGARLGLIARSKAELDVAALEIEHAGGTSMRADVRDYEALLAATERIRVHYGPLDVLICAAAIQGPIAPLVETSTKEWMETLETNVGGVVNACRAVLPGMIQRRHGKIIVLGGGGATRPRPYFSSYAASKAAVARLVESLAEEVRDHNIQVNCMSPGGTYTAMTDEILRAGERAGARDLEEAHRVRQTGGVQPDRQIQLAAFLASERSNHISGKLVHVDDDWKRLEKGTVNPELYTLRRVQKL
jgi:NAD(P)-dependent dehydrogenase (short-subunit alcohol dehydrogenase family)